MFIRNYKFMSRVLIMCIIDQRNKQKFKITALFIFIIQSIINVNISKADNNEKYAMPSLYGKCLTTPVGWGALPGSVYAVGGVTKPSPYDPEADAAITVGFGLGDPVKYVGVQTEIVSLDMSGWARYAMNIRLHRYLGKANSIAIGGETIVIQDTGSPSDAKESYYIVYSKGVQNKKFINKRTGRTKLHYSIGIGTGRFREKSDYDIDTGKGSYGTAVFGNAAYELLGICNVICDWNGLNLNVGLSKNIKFFKFITIGANIGISDITKSSGDSKRIIVGLGGGIKL